MNLQLVFDGQSLKNHEIDPKELSSALLGLDSLLREANSIVNKERTKIKLKVKASFEKGSFRINFNLDQSILDKAISLLNNDNATAILNAEGILRLLFIGGGSLYALLKFLNGSRPDKIIENEDKTFSVYKHQRYETYEKRVLEMYRNYKLRQEFERTISPIEKDGIDDFGLILDKEEEPFVFIKKEEFHAFKAVPAEEQMMDEPVTYKTNVSIIQLSFKEGNKWFVNDGEYSFYVIVEDEEFLQKVNKNIVQFGKGDILKVKIRKEQFYLSDEMKIKTSHYIEKVEDHIKPQEQLTIF